jgi:pseudouridine synthase
MAHERLNRFVSAAAGVSRRTADELIRSGRVTVGGRPVADPGAWLPAGPCDVRLDGNTLVVAGDEKIYLMAYKPDNVVTTMKDKEGRATAASLVGEMSSRVFPVGRLDYHTTGLLLFTNDGELAYKLTHPRFGVEKTYVAKIPGVPSTAALKTLRRGLPIDGVMTNPAQVTILDRRDDKAWVAIRIAEGRYHQVRRMFDAVGHRVMKLRRTAIGPLELSGVEPGGWRYLTGKEVRDLKAYVEAMERTPREAPRREPRAGKTSYVPKAKRPPAAAGEAGTGERKGPRQPKPQWKRGPR